MHGTKNIFPQKKLQSFFYTPILPRPSVIGFLRKSAFSFILRLSIYIYLLFLFSIQSKVFAKFLGSSVDVEIVGDTRDCDEWKTSNSGRVAKDKKIWSYTRNVVKCTEKGRRIDYIAAKFRLSTDWRNEGLSCFLFIEG